MSDRLAGRLRDVAKLTILSEPIPRKGADIFAAHLIFETRQNVLFRIDATETDQFDFVLSIIENKNVPDYEFITKIIKFDTVDEVRITSVWRKSQLNQQPEELNIRYNAGDEIQLKVSLAYPSLIEVNIREGEAS